MLENNVTPTSIYFKPGYGLKSRYQEYSADEKKVVMYLTSDTNEVIYRDTVYGTTLNGNGKAITVITAPDGNSKTIDLVIDPNEKILSQSATGLLSTLKIKKLNNPATGLAAQYALVGIDNDIALGATIDLVKDQFLKEAEVVVKATQADKDIDATVIIGKPYIKLTFSTTTTDKTVYVSIDDLFKLYISGNGISITYNTSTSEYSISVKIDPASESYLTVSAAGLKLSGIDAVFDTIKAYTINGKTLSTNPVLNGADIKLDGYVQADASAPILPTDTINQAFGKQAKTIEDNEQVTAAALNDHETRIKDIENTLTWDIKE